VARAAGADAARPTQADSTWALVTDAELEAGLKKLEAIISSGSAESYMAEREVAARSACCLPAACCVCARALASCVRQQPPPDLAAVEASSAAATARGDRADNYSQRRQA
jgi:hypothetical protein